MNINEAEKAAHVEARKYDMLLQDRRRINDAVDAQQDKKLAAEARLEELKESKHG